MDFGRDAELVLTTTTRTTKAQRAQRIKKYIKLKLERSELPGVPNDNLLLKKELFNFKH